MTKEQQDNDGETQAAPEAPTVTIAAAVVDAPTKTIVSGVEASPASTESIASDGTCKTLIADRYEVLEVLGLGGMGTVYKVRHIHLRNKVFALKILQKLTFESVQRFQQEAKACSLLEHPNIVRVRDFGVTGDQQPFMLMDYLEGQSLAEIIKNEGPLSPERVIHLFGQIAGALANAHAQGIIHRDVKPSNIMIRVREDGVEQAILVDFGIAKLSPSEEAKSEKALTQTGEIFGTPKYMSCEQCLGQSVDARSDIYSLGCVMFEALTGNPPFSGDSAYEVIHKQINEAPPDFPERMRKTGIGRRLEALVLKAMAKAPQNRHKLMLELASDLHQCSTGFGGMSDLKSIWGIITGRRRAADAKTVIEKNLLQALAVGAVLISVALIVCPPEMSRLQIQCERDKKILRILDDLLSQGAGQGIDIKVGKEKALPAMIAQSRKKLSALRKLMATETQFSPSFRRFDEKARVSLSDESALAAEISNLVLSDVSFSEGMFQLRERMQSFNLAMAETRNEQAQLILAIRNRFLMHYQKLEVLSAILIFAASGAIPILVILLALLFRAFRQKLGQFPTCARPK